MEGGHFQEKQAAAVTVQAFNFSKTPKSMCAKDAFIARYTQPLEQSGDSVHSSATLLVNRTSYNFYRLVPVTLKDVVNSIYQLLKLTYGHDQISFI